MSEKIRPVGNKILLAVAEPAEETVDGGIVVRRGQKRELVREAAVHALPNGYTGDLSVGDTVYVKPWTGSEVVRGGRRLLFAKESEILAAGG